jgi:prepilin-type N-terminal cleavage/methylation domain-containing protein
VLAGELLFQGWNRGFSMKKQGLSNAGFTLVEIMVVVAIIALLAAVIVPGLIRARKRAQATRVLNDLRLIEAAVDQYAVETGRTSGANPIFVDIQRYFKVNTLLYSTGKDLFGNDFGPFTVDSIPMIPPSTKDALSDVVDSEFWSPYR